MSDMDIARRRMVDCQLRARGIVDRRVLEAMGRVPREEFVDEARRAVAYEDTPVPIIGGQTVSQPWIVARMAEAARIGPTDRVLEVGTGSGYAAAVLGLLAAEVMGIERLAALAGPAAERLARLGYDNVSVHEGDGTLGLPEAAPFDAILVAAGGPSVPQALFDQLAPWGRLVMPVGPARREQRLLRIIRTGPVDFTTEDLGAVRFVPLLGAQGWE
ncbi:protein-L-isoaspartate(D-aspartate) O-methyltransferase [Rhodobacter sp. NSM]|uniref:protein-L-isoaspartate(D-aspartate) O-methyltransferase n=1 Tax=Rhodobacter sp. NSM TaxID=3457501 RepID=UPI003FD1DC5F